MSAHPFVIGALLASVAFASPAFAEESEAPTDTSDVAESADFSAPSIAAPADEAPLPTSVPGDVPHADGLVYLNPTLAENTWHMEPGPKRYAKRLAFSPAYGTLGTNELYGFRFSYNPNAWLGWEAGVAHTPGESVHALLHTFSAILRYPIPWRVQPYVTGGYGMLMVYPSGSINADPVTDNALVAGGGLELFLRDDVAIRAELKQATVFGGVKGSDETVTYGYREATVGFAFYRTLGGDASR